MEIMGPVPKARIRAAQERIVTAALTLAEDGSIYLPMGGEEEEK
jgi:flagellar motor switch protein FliG